MKKVKGLALCLGLVLSVVGLAAQTPEWQWAVGAGGTSGDVGYDIAVDSQGNQYVTGQFEGTATFGPYTLSPNGGWDIFVAKLDPTGNWLWAAQAGGMSNDYSQDIAIDGAGNTYIIGHFFTSATFGPYTLSSSGSTDIYIAKLDPSGNWVWAIRSGGLSGESGSCITSDNAGNIYISGCFYSTAANFGPFTLIHPSSSYPDIFAAKLDPAGNFIWVVKGGGTSPVYSSEISIDGFGHTYLTGHFSESASFGSHTLTSSGEQDIFAAKLDTSGNFIWAVKAGGSSDDRGLGIAINSIGFAYITGYFQGSATFGSNTLIYNGESDIFAAKLDTDGNWIWSVKAGGTSVEESNGIALDSVGNPVLIGGFFGNANFGPYTITSSGYFDIFAAKLDTDGNWMWVEQAGGTSSINGYGVAVDGAGNIYLTGYFSASAAFGSNNISSNGDSDVFVARLSTLNASFTSSITFGPEPLIVQFIDQSSPGGTPIINWFWIFGDGGSSTEQNPVHTYLNPGVYTVSLTVMDQNYQTSTLVRPDYITVIEQVYEIELLSNSNLYFYTYIEEISPWQPVVVSNTGNVDLTISDSYFVEEPTTFELQWPSRDLVLPPGAQATFNVRFAPQQVGAISDTLVIVNNSANQPLLKVRLTGTGEYVPLQIPQNVQVVMDGYDAVISWDPVTQNLHGQPVTPDRYIVLYSEWPYENNELIYYYLTSSTGLSATHHEVALFRENMFYKVKAIKFYRDDLPSAELDAWLESNLTPGMNEADLKRALNEFTAN